MTDGAVLACRLAMLRAGRLDCRINHFRVASRGNFLLRGNHRIADGALLSICQTSFRTGRCLTGNLLCLVAGCGNFLLLNDDRMTDGAVLACRLARLRAGRLDCRINHFRVTLRRDHFLRGNHRITDGAVLALGQAGRRTGRRNSRIDDLSVAGGRDFFGLGCIANCAGIGLDTGVLTGRRGRDLALIPAVALGLNGFTLGDFFVADGADCITGVAVLGAGRLTATTNLGQRVVILPAGLEGQIGKSKQFCLCPRRIIEFFLFVPDAHLDRAGNQPAIEGVTLASKATFGKRVILAGLAVDDLYRIHRADAAVGIKSDGELFKLVVHRREINVLMRIEAPAVDFFRLIIGSPAIQELIGVVFILRSAGVIVVPIPFSPILAGVVALLQDSVIPVQPADMVLVQRPLGVEGDIFAGGDVCLVAIGRAGAVLRRVPTGEIIVRAGEGVGGQVSRLIGLHGLGTHGALAIIGHKGNDRIHRPLSIKGGVRVEAHGLFVGIGRAGTVCRSVPAGEGVAFAGKGVLWQIKTRIGLTCPGRHRFFAAVGVKVNSDVRSNAPYAIQIGNGRTRAGICRLGVGAVCVV